MRARDLLNIIEEKQTRVCTDFQCPYLAGYSEDGETTYIDCRIPKTRTTEDGTVVDNYKYVVKHERKEKEKIDDTGCSYQTGHYGPGGGLEAEREAVEADGLDWDEHQKYWKGLMKDLKEITGPIPPDYDATPIRDSKDWALLKKVEKMKANGGHGETSDPR